MPFILAHILRDNLPIYAVIYPGISYWYTRHQCPNSGTPQKWRYCTFAPSSVRVRATVKLSAMFFHDESSLTIRRVGGGYESAIVPKNIYTFIYTTFLHCRLFFPFKPKESLFLSKKTYFLHCKPFYKPTTF